MVILVIRIDLVVLDNRVILFVVVVRIGLLLLGRGLLCPCLALRTALEGNGWVDLVVFVVLVILVGCRFAFLIASPLGLARGPGLPLVVLLRLLHHLRRRRFWHVAAWSRNNPRAGDSTRLQHSGGCDRKTRCTSAMDTEVAECRRR